MHILCNVLQPERHQEKCLRHVKNKRLQIICSLDGHNLYRTMRSVAGFLLVLLAMHGLSNVEASEGKDFIWGCDVFLGFCRIACFVHEKSVGPKNCAEGFVCCIPGVYGRLW
ncbi:hypothetical protein XELAEV_18016490mg [Xenopus laevis]|uniref:Beta-defensin n=1 Tax=Xenopus laevis TaxID=8355 RepID=A0A974HXE8_XENLA|nr:hypothetical protein XELAEV_18016490mg [Xenopus laevis]